MRRVCLGAALAAWLVPSVAEAQAITGPLVGTSASGPVTVDPSAVYWNPALLTEMPRPTALLSAGLIVGDVNYTRERRATYQREDSFAFKLPISSAQVDPGKTGKAPASTAHPVGGIGSLFGAMPLGHGLTAGLGVYVPYAATVAYEPGGAQRWALESVTLATLFVTPSIAYQISERLSIGAGVSYVLGFAELSKVQDFATVDDVGRALGRAPINQSNDFGLRAPPAVRELGVMARPIAMSNMIANGVTFNVGFSAKPTDKLRIGVSYQHSTRLNFNGRFALDMNADFFTSDLASQGLAYKPRVEGDATLAFTLPRTIRGGVRYDVSDRLALTLTGEYAFWSQVKSFDVNIRSPDLAMPKLGLPDTASVSLPRRWKDTIGGDLMVTWQTSKVLRLWVLGGYRSAATPDATIDAASPDGDRLIGALGAGYTISPRWTILADARVQTIVPRTVVGSDFDLGNGTYKLTIGSLAGHVQLTL